jgi:hypothetical protein
MRPLFDSATLIAFEIGRIARPYNIEIPYGPFFGGHLERWLRARKLYLLDAVALKHPRDTSFGRATFLLLFGCRDSEHVMNFLLHEPLTFSISSDDANHFDHLSCNAAIASSRLAAKPVEVDASETVGTPLSAHSHCAPGRRAALRL